MSATSSTSSSTSNGVDVAMSGLASGMDWSTLISELAQAERAPETQWEANQTTLNEQNAIFTTISQDLTTLQSDTEALMNSSLYESCLASSSNTGVATATAATGATVGSFTFDISHLATASQLNGSQNVAQVLCPNDDTSNVTIGSAGFSTPVTAGTFTVNGQQITIATTDTLQSVFNKISTATNGDVTASYDPTSDEISLTSTNQQPVVLGSDSDSSNFLQVAQLYSSSDKEGSDGNYSITSGGSLGSVLLNASISDSNLLTPVTGSGSFTINGVSFNYDASTDSLQDIMNDINQSAAGVTASYDVQNKQFVLTNNSTGDNGVSVADSSGSNFLAATGLIGGTSSLALGKNCLYTLNGGTTSLESQSNTISDASTGITGLSVTALTPGSTTVTVATDYSTITSAIQSFVNDYNTVQNYISAQSATSTDSSGDVTAGLLTGDETASDIASSLRTTAFAAATVPGLSSAMNQLGDLGITTNGQNNTISLDTATLNAALTNSLSSVQSLLSDSTNGLAVQVNTFLTDTIGDKGTLPAHQATLTQQSTAINTQISQLETKISNDTDQWNSEFDAMEQAYATMNQTLTYLSQDVTNGTL
jgi:flagellar hook-associated protein 2